MSDVLLGAGAGAGAGVWVWAGGRRWRRRLRFFAFVFLGLTGACGGLTEYGDTPPVGPLCVPVAGEVPPVLLACSEGGATPPVVAEAVAVPHASATNSTTI